MKTEAFRNYLQEEYLRRRTRNSKYSLRNFAKRLGVDAGSLSQFLNGRRDYSQKKLTALALAMGLSGEEATRIFGTKDFSQTATYVELDRLHLLGKWYYVAILETLSLDGFEPSPNWIAAKLGLSVSVVNVALQQLFSAGVLTTNADGSWQNHWQNFSTQKNERVDETALREHQKQLLELAAKSIDTNSPEDKSHTAYVSAVDKDLIPKLQEEIRQFRHRIANLIENESKKKDSIYCVQINLFPEMQNSTLTENEMDSEEGEAP